MFASGLSEVVLTEVVKLMISESHSMPSGEVKLTGKLLDSLQVELFSISTLTKLLNKPRLNHGLNFFLILPSNTMTSLQCNQLLSQPQKQLLPVLSSEILSSLVIHAF